MFVHFVENAALISLFVFISAYFFNKPLHQLSVRKKILIGLIHGVFGIIVIFIGVMIEDHIILDFRQLAVMLSAFYGGFPAAVITGVILGIYRLLFINGINSASVIGATSIVLLGICLGFISNRTYQYLLKWALLIVFSLLIGNLTLLLVLKTHLGFIPYFSAVILAGGIFAAFIHYLFHMVKVRIELNESTVFLIQLFRESDMEQIYQKALEELTKLVQCEFGSIVIIDGKHSKILSTLENGHYQLTDFIIGKEEVDSLGELGAGSTVLYPNWNQLRPMGRLEQRLFAEGVRSSIFIPILDQNEVIAGIKLASKNPYHFSNIQMHVINRIFPLLSFGLSFIDSEAKFTTVSQSAQDAIILTDSYMLITSWNKGAERIFGYTKEEALGKNIEWIIPDDYKEAHSRGVERYFSEGTSKILGKTLELEGIRKDGKVIPIELSINNWTTGGILFFSSIIRDISDRKQTEAALKESEERYRKLADLSPDGLCVYQNNRIVYANEKSAALIGLNNASELIGSGSFDFFPSNKYKEVLPLIEQLYRGQISYAKFEAQLLNVRGETIMFEVSASLIQYNGKPAIMTTFRDISERKKIEEQLKEANELLERLSNIDGLTGIPNRRYFDEMFELEWKAAARNSSPLSILLCDVDYFKAYNDTYGHQAGDYCLTEIARSFSEVLERPRDLGARYGGEEFVILLPDTNAEGAMQVAEKIRRRVGMLKIPHATSTVDPFVSTSVGAATIIPSPAYSQKQLLEQADKALYRAKHEGRNRVAVY